MASGVNVAGAIVDHAIQEAGFGTSRSTDCFACCPTRRGDAAGPPSPGVDGRSLEDVFHGEIETFAIARNSHMMWNPGPDTRLRFDRSRPLHRTTHGVRSTVRAAVVRCSESVSDSPFDAGPDEAAV